MSTRELSSDGYEATADAPNDPALGQTRRRRLRELLLQSEDGYSLDELEKILETRRSTLLADLEHLRLSFRHQAHTLFMAPPACGTCGYVFRLDSVKAPSKCPCCKSRSLSMPIFKAAADA